MEEREITKLSFFDSIIAFFVEPKELFKNFKEFGGSFLNWFIPIILVAILSLAISSFYFKSDYYKTIMIRKQIEKLNYSLQEKVSKGEINKKQADNLMELTQKNLEEYPEKYLNPLILSIQFLSIVVFMIIILLIISLYYKIGLGIILKLGDLKFDILLNIIGMLSWYAIFEITLAFILTVTTGNIFSNLSISQFFNNYNYTFLYWGSKLSIFTLLSYYILSYAISIIYEIDLTKSVLTVFSLWIGGSLILYLISLYFTFLQNILVQ
jgi:cell division protein FtsL